jgi:branched-subunit amino acid aminotransferase/4-amino-4-deoxychorismate lyase
MSGPIPITNVDGRDINGGEVGAVTKRLKVLYDEAMTKEENLFDIFRA